MTIDPATRREMLQFDTCLVSDALEKLGLPQGIAPIRRLATRSRIFGRCITVKLDRFGGDVPKRHLGANAIGLATPGDVIVISHRMREDCAGWGGLLSTSAARRGVSGVVVDGLVRDIDESEDMGFPVFARGATPVTARNRVVEVSTNQPIEIEGITVKPGDYVLGDGSGIVFVPADRFADLLSTTRELLAFEDGVRTAVSTGRPIGDVMNQGYETLLGRKKL
jgi:4-hydroxy-4-methyl-2-oxoglutarate aldolase